MFSTVIRHPISLTPQAPVVFLQYLAALAIVEGIKNYDIGYENLPVRLKWPNDICMYLLRCLLDRDKGNVLTKSTRRSRSI